LDVVNRYKQEISYQRQKINILKAKNEIYSKQLELGLTLGPEA